VVGIEAAARRYFSHGAAELTLRESLLLAAILPNPVRYGGQYLRGELEESRRVKMRNILVNMHRSGVVDDRTLEDMGRLVLQGQVSASPPRRATAGEAGPGPQVAVP
jgi:membrane peptidoglycan carboxypeptidase